MTRYRAAWLLPVSSPPIRDAFFEVDAGRIIRIESSHDRGSAVDLGPVAVLPGLVNAHTHLELSWMRGLVPPSNSMPAWARQVIARRRDAGDDDREAIRRGVQEARDAGTALVGDISNTLASVPALSASPLSAVVFYELLKFNPVDPFGQVREATERLDSLSRTPNVRVTLAAHAPYSVSGSLFRAIAASVRDGMPYTVHLGESVEEVEFLKTASGPWREVLEAVGAWSAGWSAPIMRPVEYLESVGFVGPRLIAVHGIQLDDEELRRLAGAGATLVTCPRSNGWTGAGSPPIERFYESGVRLAVGTDSLASAPDLNMFNELAEMRRLAPTVAASALIRSATLAGAEALGFDRDLGSIEPGKQAALISVRVPEDVEDVEEYLVNGVPADRIASIEAP